MYINKAKKNVTVKITAKMADAPTKKRSLQIVETIA